MAEKRMLSRRVTGSRKVNSLSLPSALLWTWSIPFFDRDGFMEAEPDFLKDNVVRRREDIPEKVIHSLVDEIVHSKLWISYHDEEGKRVVKDPKFKEFQKIEYQKETPSLWEIAKLIKDDSTTTRRPLDDNSPQDKNRVVESSEVESSKEKAATAHSWNLTEEEKLELSKLCVTVIRKWPNRFNPYAWIQKNININPKTHLHVMKRMAEGNGIKDPWPYADQIAAQEDGIYNARDSEKECNEFKKNMPSIKELLKGITK